MSEDQEQGKRRRRQAQILVDEEANEKSIDEIKLVKNLHRPQKAKSRKRKDFRVPLLISVIVILLLIICIAAFWAVSIYQNGWIDSETMWFGAFITPTPMPSTTPTPTASPTLSPTLTPSATSTQSQSQNPILTFTPEPVLRQISFPVSSSTQHSTPSPTPVFFQSEEMKNAILKNANTSYTVRYGSTLSRFDGKGPIECKVITSETGDILDVTVEKCDDTLKDAAINEIPFRIVKANSTVIDLTCGATTTAKEIVEAVDKALYDGRFRKDIDRDELHFNQYDNITIYDFTTEPFENNDDFRIDTDSIEGAGRISFNYGIEFEMVLNDIFIYPDIYFGYYKEKPLAGILRMNIIISNKTSPIIDEIIFRIGEKKFTLPDVGIYTSTTRKADGTIKEAVSIPIGTEMMKLVQEICSSKEIVRMRIKGKNGVYDYNLPGSFKLRLAEMYVSMYNACGIFDLALMQIPEPAVEISD